MANRQRSLVGDDVEQILQQARRRNRARFLEELAELFSELQTSFEETLRIKWEIGAKLKRQLEAEEYGDKVRFVREVAEALGKGVASLYEYLRLAERWPDFGALLASVRSDIEKTLAEIPDALERSEAERKMKTWRYVAHNILPTGGRKREKKEALACSMSRVPGHKCSGRATTVSLCREASREFQGWLRTKRGR